MLDERNATPLAVVSAAVVPLDVFVFGADLGWGVTWLFVRLVDSRFGDQVMTAPHMLGVYRRLGESGETGLAITVAWTVAASLLTLAAVVALAGRATGTPTGRWDRAVGAALVAAGTLFVLSRIAGNGRLLWSSVPVGGIYAIGVGTVVYRRRVGDWLARVPSLPGS